MNTILIIGAVAGVFVILAFGGWFLGRAGGRREAATKAALDQARASDAAHKAVADVLAQPTTKEDVIRDLDGGKF